MGIAALLFLFSSIRPDNMLAIRAGISDAFAPLLVTVNAPIRAVADYARTISGLATLQEENARLAEENAKLREWYQRAMILKSENESLQELLNIKLPPQHGFVTARIIADSGNAYAHTLLVLAGSKDGVEKGQAVLSGDGVLGRVIEAGDTTARVLLLTDINARVPVMIEGANVHAIAAGTGNSLPALVRMPLDSAPQEGQRVITSGRGGLFPFGLPVGVAAKTADGGWIVRTYADTDRTDYVRIVRTPEDPRLKSAPPAHQ